MEKNNLKNKDLICTTACARLVDIESYIYILRNAETKRPKRYCSSHNFFH